MALKVTIHLPLSLNAINFHDKADIFRELARRPHDEDDSVQGEGHEAFAAKDEDIPVKVCRIEQIQTV